MGLLALLFGGIVALDSTVKPGDIEGRLTQWVRTELRQVGEVKVHVHYGSAMQALTGRLTGLELELSRFKLEDVSLEDLATVAPQRQAEHPGVPRTQWRHSSSSQPFRPKSTRRIGFPVPLKERLANPYPKEATISTVRLDARDFSYAGLPLDSLVAELTNVRYEVEKLFEKGELSLLGMDGGKGTFRLGAAAVRELAEKRVEGFEQVGVKLRAGRLEVTAQRKVLVAAVPLTLTARLASPDGVGLWLVEPEATVAGLPLPARTVRELVAELNPVITVPFEALAPLRGRITDVTIKPQGIVVQARLGLGAAAP